MELNESQLADLYPEKIYTMRKPVVEAVAWKLKPGTRALFVMHEDEFKNKTLTDLLRKIVLSINLPAEMAGFGVIRKGASAVEFTDFPGNIAVVFDDSLNTGATNPMDMADKRIYFSRKLAQLTNSEPDKRLLWANLKEIKKQLGLE
jgi:hypothetical protein